MKHLIPFIVTICFGCAKDEPKPTDPVEPVDPLPPVAEPEPIPEWIDGETATAIVPTAYLCSGEPLPPPLYAVSDVIQQSGRGFDLIDWTGGFFDFLAYDLERKPDGSFNQPLEVDFNLFGAIITIKRTLDGRIDANGFSLHHDYDIGGYDDNTGDWVSGCRLVAEISGRQRYLPWEGAPRTGIDGKFRARKLVLEDSWLEESGSTARRIRELAPKVKTMRGGSLDFSVATKTAGLVRTAPSLLDEPFHPGDVIVSGEIVGLVRSVDGEKVALLLPEGGIQAVPLDIVAGNGVVNLGRVFADEMEGADPLSERFVTIDIVSQAPDDSWFSLRGTRFGFDPLRAADGTVDVRYQAYGFDIAVRGTVTEDQLDLELTWLWFDPPTGEVYRWLRERYVGEPRYEPHLNSRRARTEYNVLYEMTADTCSSPPYVYRRVPRVLEHGPDTVWLGLTGSWREPAIALPESGGHFQYGFEKTWGVRYDYVIEGDIDGDALSGTIRIDVFTLPPDGTPEEYICGVEYALSNGYKRFETRPVVE